MNNCNDYGRLSVLPSAVTGAYPGFRQGGGESVKIIIRSKIYNLGKMDR